jgi:hypothetical protein
MGVRVWARAGLGLTLVGGFALQFGCDPLFGKDDDPVDSPTPAGAPVPDLEAATDPTEIVLRVTDPASPCPPATADGWTVSRLFEDPEAEGDVGAQDDRTIPAVTEATGEDPFAATCVYRTTGSTEETPFKGLASPGFGAVDLSRQGIPGVMTVSRIVMAPSAIDTAAIEADLYARLQHEAGAPSRGAGGNVRPPSATPRVVLVDTAPDVKAPWPVSDELWSAPASHGKVLAALLQLLTCPDREACPVSIGTAQALRRTGRPAADGTDGQYGTLTDLAFGIRRAVRRWRVDAAAQQTGPLILNLSVAWHPLFGGGVPEGWEVDAEGASIDRLDGTVTKFSWADAAPSRQPPDVRAVLDALFEARCAGALIFAAAGNRSGGPRGQDGPLMPGAWQALPLESLGSCALRGDTFSPPDPKEPLLWAVGGVEASGDELLMGRPDSTPVLTAYAANAWFPHTETLLSDPVRPYTGTSVSTVVASATAALTWSLGSLSSGAEVMRAVLDKSDAGNPVAPWLVASAGGVTPSLSDGGVLRSRVLRPCDLAAAFDRTWSCAAPAEPAAGDWGEGSTAPAGTLTWPGSATTQSECGSLQLYTVATPGGPAAAEPCSDQVVWDPMVSPWVYPQPPTDGCGDCFLAVGKASLYIALTRLYDHTSLALVVETASTRYRFALPASSFPPGVEEVTLSVAGSSLPAGILRAGLTGVLDGRSRTYPLILKP